MGSPGHLQGNAMHGVQPHKCWGRHLAAGPRVLSPSTKISRSPLAPCSQELAVLNPLKAGISLRGEMQPEGLAKHGLELSSGPRDHQASREHLPPQQRWHCSLLVTSPEG